MHAMTSRQPAFTMPWQERHSRLTTFFRWLLGDPGRCSGSRSGRIALIVTVPIAWFALLFTGRYPESLYEFHASFARYLDARSTPTTRWRPTSGRASPGADDDGYPVRLVPRPAADRLQPAQGRDCGSSC